MKEEMLETIATSKFYDFQLEQPFEFGDKEVFEVRLNRFKGKHLKKLDLNNMDMKESLRALEMSTHWTPPQIDELDAADIMGMIEVVTTFLTPSR